MLADGEFIERGTDDGISRYDGLYHRTPLPFLGLLIGTYAPASAILEYVFSFVRYLPASAFIPLFILWIGIDEPEKIAVIILGSLPQLVLMVATNVRNVPMSMIEVSLPLRNLQSRCAVEDHPAKIFTGHCRQPANRLGWAWTYIIVAELVGASSGIGYMIIQSQRMMNTSRIFRGNFDHWPYRNDH